MAMGLGEDAYSARCLMRRDRKERSCSVDPMNCFAYGPPHSDHRTFPTGAHAVFQGRKLVWEPIAQSVEHLTFNQRVAGSNPAGLTNEINDL
jgi:hypothetical protein